MTRFARYLTLTPIAALFLLVLVPSLCASGETLKRVRATGVLRCGVSEGLPGFSEKDAGGRWKGMDADFCRAVAAAALGDAEKVAFVPLAVAERYPALRTDKIDLLSRNTTWSISREAGLGVQFAGTLYYDGQGFMVPVKSTIRKVSDLKNATICVQKSTTTRTGLEEYFQGKKWKYQPLVFDSLFKAREAFLAGRCKAYTSDRSQLAAIRFGLPGGEKAYRILPGQISKEPLGPVTRRGDEEWSTLVRWVLFALLEAEELGVTQADVSARAREKGAPYLEHFLGSKGSFGKMLGVGNDWVVRIIGSVGNYGEMFERNLGAKSPLHLERGLNRLWNKGGLMYAPPFL